MSNPVRIALFNHKSGVGKTTLTANIAFTLADMGKSVLLVDGDPQCNLTSFLLSDEQVGELLNESSGSRGQTLWTAVRPVLEDTGPSRLIEPTKVGNLKLVPGDIKLAEFEDFLYGAWSDSLRRRLGALRAIASISTLISWIHSESPFDYVFYDTGSNVGPLNRILLLDCDCFILPVTCDLFSVRALATLGQAVSAWMRDADTIGAIAPDNMPLLEAKPALLGYIHQPFRVYGRAVAREATSYLPEIKNRIHDDVAVLLEHGERLAPSRADDPNLGEVKGMSSLVQFAQREGVSMWECSGGTPAQRRAAKQSFACIASRIDGCAVGRLAGEQP